MTGGSRGLGLAIARALAGDGLEVVGTYAHDEAAARVASERARADRLAISFAHCDAGSPARVAGLAEHKGSIAAGRDADLVVFDPDAEWVVDASAIRFRHPLTPYAGRRVRGRVRAVYLRGDLILEDGRLDGPPRGRLLSRP